jgi:hypothetical protein
VAPLAQPQAQRPALGFKKGKRKEKAQCWAVCFSWCANGVGGATPIVSYKRKMEISLLQKKCFKFISFTLVFLSLNISFFFASFRKKKNNLYILCNFFLVKLASSPS